MTLELIRRAHRIIPLPVRKLYVPVFYGCFSHVKNRILNVFFPPVFVFEGRAREGGTDFAFAYAGGYELTKKYWAGLALAPGYKTHRLGRCLFWRVPRLLKKNHPACGFLLAEHTAGMLKFLSKKPGFRLPQWVDMEIILPNVKQKEWRSQRKQITRRIRKYKLNFELTRAPDRLDDFYHNIHLPYVKNRYEEAAFLAKYRSFQETFTRGELILIKKGDEILAGSLFEYFPGMVCLRHLGVRDGKWEYVQQGVIGAIYYFLMDEMEKRGYEKMYLGGCRPFLSDGLFRYKSSLNGRLVAEKAKMPQEIHRVSLWFSFLKDSPALRDFLVNNPFIYFPDPDKPCCALFTRSGSEEIEKLLEFLKYTGCKGLKEMTLFVFDQAPGEPFPPDIALLGPGVPVRRAEELFS